MLSPKKKSSKITDRVACVILAGGQGSRLYPLTLKRCKPAVSFGGRYRLIDIPISNSLNSSINHIFIISQYFSSGLNDHIKKTYSLDHFQGGLLTLLNPEERKEGKIWYEGTADAVRKNIEILTQMPFDLFIILSGDQLYNMDLLEMITFAREKDADLTIASLPVPKSEAPRLGLLSIDDEATICDFHEKPKSSEILDRFALTEAFKNSQNITPKDKTYFLASMGIYVFKREVLIDLLEQDLREDFGKHLIPSKLKTGKSCAFLHQGYWEDIGTISSFYKANMSLTQGDLGVNFYDEISPIYTHTHHLPGARFFYTSIVDSIICDGCVIEKSQIERSIIGIRSLIGENSVIRDSILLGNDTYLNQKDSKEKKTFKIGKNVLIEKAIIDENVIIGNNVRLTNEKNLTHYDGDGVFIRDGIIIIASGTQLPDNFTF